LLSCWWARGSLALRWRNSTLWPVNGASVLVLAFILQSLTYRQHVRVFCSRKEVQHVSDSRSKLMRGFTHDVKNPLGAADGYLQLLLDGVIGEITDAQRQSMQRARQAIQSGLGLIGDLLELAQMEAGELKIHKRRTKLAPILEQVAQEYQAQAEARGHSFVLDPLVHDITLETDPVRVRQILGNLLSNAIKYTPAGGEVGLRLRDGGPGGLGIEVWDTGPGIPEGKRQLLFREFTRLTPHEEPGAGVGLSISEQLTRALGGRIAVESEEGRGSAFVLWLPTRESDPYVGRF
jgi:signal transduction histidine kinase